MTAAQWSLDFGSERGAEPLRQIHRRLTRTRPALRVPARVVERVLNMDASIISVLAALGGAAIGGLTSVVGAGGPNRHR